MKRNSLILMTMLCFMLISFSSCEAIGDIFKAGVWVGVIGVCVLAGIIIYFIGRTKK